MLQIKDIRKQYVTGELVQTALDGVSLTLRDNEFVAILGPSGSGKTTLLNVIGGLDRYDSGDLIINGISTRKYNDRDWDSYRNHTIGFVFQSYNLIPHQTVLANVELALTISGVSRAERRKRAAKALEQVGLGNQLHKRPNQMSGGQMQRVAIARALVNNPDILLADEPTGALDSETSVQIMDLLQEVAKDRLVVMVTHNPELAEEYANRIVRVKDGKIIGDTNPYEVSAADVAPPTHKNMGKSSMSFLTALSLSFNNLKTKLGRTLLTAFAGSIGIIGIALIMSLSTGFQYYIDQIQEDTLSNYPLVIQTETANMGAAMAAFGTTAQQAAEAPDGVLVEQQMIYQMFAQIGTNDLRSFKTYLDENYDQVDETINAISYSYGVKPLIFRDDPDQPILQVNPGTLFGDITGNTAMSAYMDTDLFHEMLDNRAMLESQYDVLQGRWPEKYDELIVVLSDPHQITDYMAYTLGMKDPAELNELISTVMRGETLDPDALSQPMEWTYDDLMALKFRMIPASAQYRFNQEYNVWENMSTDEAYMRKQIDTGMELRIVGIVCPKEGVSTTALTAGIAYRSDLTGHIIAAAKDSPIVQAQLADPSVDVFTGQPFGSDRQQALNFENMITVDGDALSSAFGMNISMESIMNMFSDYMSKAQDAVNRDTAPAQADFKNTLKALASNMLSSYISTNADETGAAKLRLADVEGIVDGYLASENASALIQSLATKYDLPADSYPDVYRSLLVAMLTDYVSRNMTAEPIAAPALLTEQEDTPSEPAPEDPTPGETIPDDTLPDDAPPEGILPDTDISQLYAPITSADVEQIVSQFSENTVVSGTAAVMAGKMAESQVQATILRYMEGFGDVVMGYMGSVFYVNEEKIASAFQFNMTEEDLRRLMEAMSGSTKESTAESNLKALGYADAAEPVSISLYFVDFEGKEAFIRFLDDYNEKMEAAGMDDQVIRYTDLTGIMMSSVRTIIDSVSYVLIAFVSVSLIVSSIMIGIITYISVMERTKEIGVLRAIGASKRNISQVFNAETFIIGLCSGLIGVGVTLLLNIPINSIIHSLTGNMAINAQLPAGNAVILIVLSMILTLIGGLIPSKQAAKKDPVIALRSE